MMSANRLESARRASSIAGRSFGLVLLAASMVSIASSALAQSVWEFSPYRVQAYLALEAAPEFGPELERDLAAQLASRVNTLIGAAWDLTVTPAPPSLHRVLTVDLESVTNELLPKQALQADKVFLLSIQGHAGGYELAARELDVRTMTWNAVVRLSVWQAAKLRDGLFRATCDAFAPLAQIGAVEKKHVTLRLKAAALPVRDHSLTLVKPGTVFQPLFRYNDREGKARRVTTVPFTFLIVDKAVKGEVQCTLHTGVRTALSGKRRGRVEQLALGVVPPQKPTTLIVQARNDPKQVLAGYDVYLSSEGSGAKWLGRTDWQGKLTVMPAAEPLRVLVIKSGGELLARMPVVPGLSAELAAPVPKNDEKLRAEGFLKGFQEDLIDMITRREVLLAQARSQLKANRLDVAEKVVTQLRAIHTRDELLRALDQEAKKVVSLDVAVQRKIDILFNETRKVLGEQLDPTAIDKIDEALRAAQTKTAPAGN
jgi:hypothetical protein